MYIRAYHGADFKLLLYPVNGKPNTLDKYVQDRLQKVLHL